MVMQINIGDHTSSEGGYVALPNNLRQTTRWARTKAQAIAKGLPSADVYFKTLPDGKSLTELLADSSIWVNYGPSLTVFGEAVISGTELAIGPGAYRIGRWTVLATLIHELAHINGAPGGTDRRAEEALLHCGLGKQSERTTGRDDPNTPYSPNIAG